MTTIIDTGAIICANNTHELHHQWAVQAIGSCKQNGPLLVCDVVFTEISVVMHNVRDTQRALDVWDVERIDYTDDALFLAGKIFHKYKSENKGPKLGVMPDFFIGALASASGLPLMTTNAKDMIKYFPGLQIIAPPKTTK